MMQGYGEEAQDRQYQKWIERGKAAGLSGRDLAEFAGSEGKRLPAQAKPVTVKNIARDGVDPATGKPYEGLWDHEVKPDGSETWAKRPEDAKSRPTILSSDVVTVNHARALSKQGVAYNNAAGEPIDMDQVPNGMVLQAIHQGTKTFYEPRDVQDKVVDVNGMKYAVSPFEVQDLPQGAGTTLGAKNAPTEGSHEVIAVDANGNPTVNTLRSTRTPQASGVPGRPGGTTPGTPAQAPRPQTQGARPQGGNITPQATPSPAPTTARLRGMPPGMYNQMLQRATPVREAATQIFGDPSQPDLKGLKDYIEHCRQSAVTREARESVAHNFRWIE